MHFKLFLSLFVNVVVINLVKGSIVLPVRNEAFNKDLYEEVLDAELCDQQIQIIRNNTLMSLFFADAGMRVPRGVLEGNTMDMGNYHQCIGLNQNIADTELQGKYCMIRVPLNQTFVTPWMNSDMTDDTSNFNPNNLRLDSETIKSLREFYAMKNGMNALTGAVDVDRLAPNNPLASLTFRLAVCVPKPCTTEQAINSFAFNMTAVGFQYDDDFCRLPDDKPWVPGDTVIIVLFSIIGLLTVVSTSYDIWHTIILKKDPKTVSVIGRCFSVYTNGRRVMNFQSSPNSIECLDGIRALAMIWVVLGHTFSSVVFWQNPLDAFTWASSWQSLWITSAPITVDTFFTLSGFLVVYTTLGKFNSMQLLKNIHLFWLNRLLRMFPLLAVAVLFEATYLHRMADGPVWEMVEDQVNRCRTYWWSTLLYMQNYLTPACVGQTWYLAIDVQLHILSPIVLFWVLMGKQRIAWAALLSVLVAVLTASTTYIFIKEFPSTVMARPDRLFDYLENYYMNTLTRASPFLVGMLFGYIVKTKKLEMSKIGTVCYWAACFTLSTFIIYATYPISQPDWDNQVADSLYNSFIRPLWGLFIGCMIFACFNGYGGPINWFLSLSVWKLQSRMSYGIYLFHFGLMNAVNYSVITPPFFSVKSYAFKFLAHYSLSFAVTFFLVVLIDAPCSTLFKMLLGGGGKKPRRKEIDEDQTKDVEKTS